MRRVFSVAIPGILMAGALLCAAPAATAQRVGGHSGGGFSGGHAGGFSGGHSFGGGISGSGGRFSGSFGSRSYAAPRSFGFSPRMRYSLPVRNFGNGYRGGLNTGRGAWSGRGGDRDRGRYRSPYRGYGGYGGYPYATGWELTPWELGYPDFLGYGNDIGDPQPDAQIAAPTVDDGGVPDDDYRPAYGAAPSYAAPAVASAPARPEPELMLIFNDGHRQPIRNYALTGNSVIVLDDAASGRQQQIPLGELNLPATEQAAQQAGLDFTPPA